MHAAVIERSLLSGHIGKGADACIAAKHGILEFHLTRQADVTQAGTQQNRLNVSAESQVVTLRLLQMRAH